MPCGGLLLSLSSSYSLVREIVISIVLPSLTGWQRLVNARSGATHEVKVCWSHREATHHAETGTVGTFVVAKGPGPAKTNDLTLTLLWQETGILSVM